MPRVVNDSVSISYRVEGAGPPLILQHGFTDSSETWYEMGYVGALKSNYRLILIDSRGHGQSDKPHVPSAYTPEKFASDIVAVLDDLGTRTVGYWGYSQGGKIAFALARHAPERISCFVVGGASATSASAYPTDPGKEDPLIMALRSGPDGIIKVFGEWATDQLRTRLLANDTAALIACRQQGLGEFSDVVGKIAVATLFYAGSGDPIYNPARRSASEVAGAQFVSLSGLNHIAAMCRSDLILPHVKPFLARAIGG
jgi:pimeloyl-ACP methyl ester carboxylesterase